MISAISSKRERYGMYEAQEQPKGCKKCGSTDTRTKALWEICNTRRRKRECIACGHIFTTDIPIVTAANPVMPGLKMV